MKRVLKITGFVLIGLIVVGVSTCFFVSKKLPVGETGLKANTLADDMWKSLNKEAWDSTSYVRWSFKGEHHYIWDKKANLAEIKWDDYRVLLNPDSINGVVYEKDVKLEGSKSNKIIDKAWSYWCNDMYWLAAPYKIRDAGTKLSVSPDGNLKVTYETGGTTPGDSYIWKLDNNNVPKSFEMYVSIIPVKGLEATWETYTTISTGAILATEHKIAGNTLSLAPISGGNTLADVGIAEDVWKEIRK